MASIEVPKSTDSEGKTSNKITPEYEYGKKKASGRADEKLIELSQENKMMTLS